MPWYAIIRRLFGFHQTASNGLLRLKIRALSEISCGLGGGIEQFGHSIAANLCFSVSAKHKMSKLFYPTSLIGILLLPAFIACQKKSAQTVDLGIVKLAADPAWKTVAPSSQMRKAQFALPHVAEDSQDAELVVYYFGAGQGGTVEANLERWYSQFVQPDSSSSAAKAKTSHEVVDGMNLTSVDLSGTYVAPKMPGSEEHNNEPNFRMLAAVLETPHGPYFFKLVGPEKTVGHWATSFSEFMKSAKKTRPE